MCLMLEETEVGERTRIYAGTAHHPTTGKLVHVMAYGTKFAARGPTGMLLAVPSMTPLVQHVHVLDGNSARGLLTAYDDAIDPFVEQTRGMMKSFGASDVEVYDVGDYTMVTATDAGAIYDALSAVAPARRPPLKRDIFEQMGAVYQGFLFPWRFIIACSDGSPVDAAPIVLVYEPHNPAELFIPGLDAHDGKPAKIGAMVTIDHSLFIGSTIKPIAGEPVSSRAIDSLDASLRPFFPATIAGMRHRNRVINGDWRVTIADMHGLKNANANRVIRRVAATGGA